MLLFVLTNGERVMSNDNKSNRNDILFFFKYEVNMKRRILILLILLFLPILIALLSMKKFSSVIDDQDILETNFFLKYQDSIIPFDKEQKQELFQLLNEGYYVYKPIKLPSGGWDYGIVMIDTNGNIINKIIFFKDDLSVNGKYYFFFNLDMDRIFELCKDTKK